MIDVTELRKIFVEKLVKTNDMDAAFQKAVWIAYKQGVADASTSDTTAVLLQNTGHQ